MSSEISPNLLKRLNKEIAEIEKATESLDGITIKPRDPSDLMIWECVIPGPSGSPYEGGQFIFAIKIPDNYPYAPPTVTLLTPIYHCNISSSGYICVDILGENWSPLTYIYKLGLSLSSLLTSPNPDDPLVPDLGNLLKTRPSEYDDMARIYTELVANPKTAKLSLADARKALEQGIDPRGILDKSSSASVVTNIHEGTSVVATTSTRSRPRPRPRPRARVSSPVADE